jgi:hypothetical protein
MRKLLFSIAALIMLFAVGCGPALSLHPLCTVEEAVFDPALVGRWGDIDDDNGGWIFRQLEGNLYSVTLKENSADSLLPLEGRLVHLGKYTFMDVMAREDDIENFLAIPAHAFLRLDLQGDSLGIAYLDDSYLSANCNLIRHEVMDDNIILTASPRELQAFVLQCAEDVEAFEMEWCYRK